jgi:peptidyl-prolyl cis-trans isomerase D
MYDFVAKNKKLIMIVLMVLIIPPFAFFGIDSYFRGGATGQTVARVGNYSVSSEEFGRALREQQDALRRAAEGRVDPAVLDSNELRVRTLEGLIQRHLLVDSARRSGMAVSDEQLKSIIASEPSFHDGTGNFSMTRYEQFLRNEGLTPASFESRLRQDIMLRQVAGGFADSGFVPRTVVERLARLAEQRREISHALIAPEKFLAQVKLDADAARKYYDANPAEFRTPEQARVEYVVLSMAALMQEVKLDPAEVRQYYETNRRQFEVVESRQAAHIFFSFEPGAGAEAKSKARAQADEIYQQVRKKPASFTELAKKHSQDPGSAARGGDLGFLPRGAMKDVPEFEEALYKLKPGEISAPVESKLGFHIIRVIAVQPAKGKSFEEMRAQIEAELRKQGAAKRFAQLADTFNNVAYEQSDSLKPAAEVAKSQPQTSSWLTRAGAGESALNNPKLLAAIFSEDALRNKRNTEAVEVTPGILVTARVIEHKPEGMRPFEAVRGDVENRLAMREATRLAAEEGRRLLEDLRKGTPVQVAWSVPQFAGLSENKGLPEPILRQALRVDPSRLPAYAGVENLLGGYTLVRVSRVQEAGDIPQQRIDALARNLRQILGQEAISAYVAALRQQAGVSINKEQLEKKTGDR